MDQERYSRHLLLPEIGQEGQQKILNARVLVVGAGGLGCPLLQYLTAGGIGNIGIIDHDQVDQSNLIRQVLFGENDIGKNKAIAAQQRLKQINSQVHTEAFPHKLTSKNALDLFKNYDLIVDGTDNFNTRYLVNDACVLTQKPLISGSLYKYEGQVSVFNYQNGPTYRCAYPEAPSDHLRLSCSELGVLNVLPGIIGNFMANEIFKIILKLGHILSEKILIYSALSAKIQHVKIHKRPEEIEKILAIESQFSEKTYHNQRDLYQENIQYLSITLAKNKLEEEVTMLISMDSKEFPDLSHVSQEKILNIPFGSLRKEINQLEKNKVIIISSSSDVKNRAAYRSLQKSGFTEVYILDEEKSKTKRNEV